MSTTTIELPDPKPVEEYRGKPISGQSANFNGLSTVLKQTASALKGFSFEAEPGDVVYAVVKLRYQDDRMNGVFDDDDKLASYERIQQLDGIAVAQIPASIGEAPIAEIVELVALAKGGEQGTLLNEDGSVPAGSDSSSSDEAAKEEPPSDFGGSDTDVKVLKEAAAEAPCGSVDHFEQLEKFKNCAVCEIQQKLGPEPPMPAADEPVEPVGNVGTFLPPDLPTAEAAPPAETAKAPRRGRGRAAAAPAPVNPFADVQVGEDAAPF